MNNQIENNFNYHAPKEGQTEKYAAIRKKAKELAYLYVLVNFNTSIEQDLDRIYTLRDLGYWPYVMIYDKDKLPKRHIVKHLQRWVNNRKIFETTTNFEDYFKA